jgi:hypothetical protein
MCDRSSTFDPTELDGQDDGHRGSAELAKLLTADLRFYKLSNRRQYNLGASEVLQMGIKNKAKVTIRDESF